MAAFLAEVMLAPITAAILVMGMVDAHRMVPGLLGATLIGELVSTFWGPKLHQEMAICFIEQAGAG